MPRNPAKSAKSRRRRVRKALAIPPVPLPKAGASLVVPRRRGRPAKLPPLLAIMLGVEVAP